MEPDKDKETIHLDTQLLGGCGEEMCGVTQKRCTELQPGAHPDCPSVGITRHTRKARHAA